MTAPVLAVFLDRSIGTRRIAEAMRAMPDIDVQTILDRYGPDSQFTPDITWIADATADGRILIGADTRIRYNPLERQTLCLHKARCFTIPSGNLTGAQMIERIQRHIETIRQLAAEPGPYVYHVHGDQVRRVNLDCDDC